MVRFSTFCRQCSFLINLVRAQPRVPHVEGQQPKTHSNRQHQHHGLQKQREKVQTWLSGDQIFIRFLRKEDQKNSEMNKPYGQKLDPSGVCFGWYVLALSAVNVHFLLTIFTSQCSFLVKYFFSPNFFQFVFGANFVFLTFFSSHFFFNSFFNS